MSINSDTVTYSRKYNAVCISGWVNDFVIDVPSIKQAIENVKAGKASYATEAAYERALAVYTGALEYAKAIGLTQA